VDPKENRITIEREEGTQQTYDPRRLSGVSVHREVEHEFSTGDRIQFTAPSKELKVANRELGTIERVSSEGDLSVRLDSGREVRFNIREHAHLDHEYAVTSHSSQGQTAKRVLIHVDTASFPAASVVKVRNVQQQRWNSSPLHRRPNQFPCEECGPPKRSKAAIVLE
jgi:hypothetical protein